VSTLVVSTDVESQQTDVESATTSVASSCFTSFLQDVKDSVAITARAKNTFFIIIFFWFNFKFVKIIVYYIYDIKYYTIKIYGIVVVKKNKKIFKKSLAVSI